MNNSTITADTQVEDDPHKVFWFFVYVLIMAVAALPLFGLRIPRIFPYTPTLVVHEFAAFAFVGHTFFSNIWSLRIRRTQPREFGIWLGNFLTDLPSGHDSSWLPTATVSDRSDGKLAHLDGLNLSRAWMLEGIATGLPSGDPRQSGLIAAAFSHRETGLLAVTGEHYEGGHWLGTYAMYLSSRRGLSGQWRQ